MFSLRYAKYSDRTKVWQIMIEIDSSLAEDHTKQWTDNLLTRRYQFQSMNLSGKEYSTHYLFAFNEVLPLRIFGMIICVRAGSRSP